MNPTPNGPQMKTPSLAFGNRLEKIRERLISLLKAGKFQAAKAYEIREVGTANYVIIGVKVDLTSLKVHADEFNLEDEFNPDDDICVFLLVKDCSLGVVPRKNVHLKEIRDASTLPNVIESLTNAMKTCNRHLNHNQRKNLNKQRVARNKKIQGMVYSHLAESQHCKVRKYMDWFMSYHKNQLNKKKAEHHRAQSQQGKYMYMFMSNYNKQLGEKPLESVAEHHLAQYQYHREAYEATLKAMDKDVPWYESLGSFFCSC